MLWFILINQKKISKIVNFRIKYILLSKHVFVITRKYIGDSKTNYKLILKGNDNPSY